MQFVIFHEIFADSDSVSDLPSLILMQEPHTVTSFEEEDIKCNQRCKGSFLVVMYWCYYSHLICVPFTITIIELILSSCYRLNEYVVY